MKIMANTNHIAESQKKYRIGEEFLDMIYKKYRIIRMMHKDIDRLDLKFYTYNFHGKKYCYETYLEYCALLKSNFNEYDYLEYHTLKQLEYKLHFLRNKRKRLMEKLNIA